MKSLNQLLKIEKPSVVHLKRPVLFLLLAAFILLIGFVLIYAFSPSVPRMKQAKLSSENDEALVVSSALDSLPQNYQDVDKVNRYVYSANQAKEDPATQAELDTLKKQQAELESRLASLSTASTSFNPNNPSVQLEQARNSGLFFPGAVPQQTGLTQGTTASSQGSASDSKGAETPTSYQQQNMQSQKIDFLKASDQQEDIYNLNTLVKPISPYEVQAGTLVRSVLITSVNTSLPGEVVAQVVQDIYDSVTGRFLLIPKGSKLLGQYDSQVAYGQTRVLIAFTRIIRPDGSSILLGKLPAADIMGQSGMQGNVDNHWARVLGAATLSTLLSVGSGVASDNVGDNNTYYRSAQQNAALAAAGNVSQVGQELTSRAINIQPTLTIPSGFQFNVIVNKDMVLEPYYEKNS